MKILGKYQITYQNGFIQEKNLISHTDYVNIIKSIQDKIYKLEVEDYKKNRDKNKNIKR